VQEGNAFTDVTPSFQTNPLYEQVPTWQKFEHFNHANNYRWDAGEDWLEDYTYYAEVVGDSSDDWWGKGLTKPSNGDADIPQPKVFRSMTQSAQTLLDVAGCVDLKAICILDNDFFVPSHPFQGCDDDLASEMH
jgi:hypothetical protein